MLTSKEIADEMFNDLPAYEENIKKIIANHLNNDINQMTYWDAWFRGAEGKDLEDADKGKVYNGDREKELTKVVKELLKAVQENTEYLWADDLSDTVHCNVLENTPPGYPKTDNDKPMRGQKVSKLLIKLERIIQ